VDSTDNSEDRAYTYDAVGNRKTLTENGSVYHYCYGASSCAASPNGNRLASIRIGSTAGPIHRSFSYDDNGRVLEKRDAAGTLVYALA
jgi:YD repeat-containing protein